MLITQENLVISGIWSVDNYVDNLLITPLDTHFLRPF